MSATVHRLFSYGTLQLDQVQIATFGRSLTRWPDHLPGFSLSLIEITDPDVVATSGQTHHPIVTRTGDPQDRIAGMVFEVTAADLEQADQYEVSDYRRERFRLASGVEAWVYVAAAAMGG
jgi:Gamma-glutamyl cyclotransferase, AIG2-like